MLDCGRYLRTDNCTLNRERFDYARVLIAISSLKVVNVVVKLLVDGVMVEVKMIEEWSFNLGKDACMFEEDKDSKVSDLDHIEDHGDPEHSNNVDVLVEKLVDDLA